ncbi:ABC transporter substrate-binding protein [Bradyrhizobium sp. WSM4349]|nr:ABC transporter substrate-binding protein [Bradyrhizobium sp. WSM4349]
MSVEATHMTIPISPDRTRRGSFRLRLPKVSRSVLLSTLTVAVLLAGWAIVTEMGWANELFLPKPQAVWAAFVKTMTKGYQGATLLQHLGASLYRILTAFTLACLIGIPLGVLMGVSRNARALLNPLIEFYRPLPPLGLYTLLVMWLGIGESSKLSLLFLAGLPGIVISTIQAVTSVDPVYVRAAQSLGATRRHLLFHVYLPAAGPLILAGMRISLGFTYTVLVAAEIVAASAGIGWMIWDAAKFLLSDVVIMPDRARPHRRRARPHDARHRETVDAVGLNPILIVGETSMKRLIATLAVTTLALTAAVRAEDKPAKVTVGYLNLVNAQLVTKHLGLLAKEMPGVDIKYVKIGGGGDMLRAIAGSDVDFGGLGNPPTAIGATRSLPIKGILVINMLDYVESMVVRADKNITSLKDLKGKTVAAPFGSTTHYLLLQALKEEGVDPASMKILDLAPSDIAAAWLRGDIDAAWFWEPNLGKAVKNGGKILVTSGEMAKRGYPTWDIGVVMNAFAEKYPSYVDKFIKAECEGIDFWLKNPEKTAEIIAEELSLPLEDAQRMMKGTGMIPCSTQLTEEYLGTSAKKGKFVDTLISTADFLVKQERLPKLLPRADFEAFIQPAYLEKVIGR